MRWVKEKVINTSPENADSFTQKDFDKSRQTSWGKDFTRFKDFAHFKQYVDQYVQSQLCSERCFKTNRQKIEDAPPQPECIAAPEPKLPPLPVKSRPVLRPKPNSYEKHPRLDLSSLKLSNGNWGNPWTSPPSPPTAPSEIIPILSAESIASHVSRKPIDDLEKIPAPRMLSSRKLVRTVLATAEAQTASSGGLKGKVIDLVLTIDTSGSMENMAGMARNSIEQIIEDLSQSGAKEVRIGVVIFSDTHHIEILSPLEKMISNKNQKNVTTLLLRLDHLTFQGGIEPVGFATLKAIQLLNSPKQVGNSRQIVVLTDKDGLSDDRSFPIPFSEAKKRAETQGIAVHLITY
jgi:Mg-chelatase subunit ChlD